MHARALLYRLVHDYNLDHLRDFLNAPYRAVKMIAIHLETMAYLGDTAEQCLKEYSCAVKLFNMYRYIMDLEPYEIAIDIEEIARLFTSRENADQL